MSEVTRVLHVVGRLDRGGAESRIMDLYRSIDRDKVQFDFVEHTTDRCAYEDEIESLGGKIYHLPRFKVYNWFSYRKSWITFMKEHPEFRVVHGHMTSTAAIYLPVAKKYGNCMTIAHARSAGVDPGIKGKITRLLRRNLIDQCDRAFTCSELAGIAVFGQKAVDAHRVTMIPNAIDAAKFIFDQRMRERMRTELGISDQCMLLGHVGRFNAMKNHKFMLEILHCLIGRGVNAKLIFLGDGPMMEEMKALAVQLQIDEAVIFAGNHKNVEDYYQAFDVFLLPSVYEGLPGTAIEAQASGLPGLLSDQITKEAGITELIQYLPIDQGVEIWCDKILAVYKTERTNRYEQIRKAGFDTEGLAEQMLSVYTKA